jgi:CheY-like chemotaxis protein
VLRERFALILLDVSMPVMDGFQTARLIREHPRFELTRYPQGVRSRRDRLHFRADRAGDSAEQSSAAGRAISPTHGT